MFVIRQVEKRDAGQLSRIYRHYVLKTAVSFDYDPPSEEEFAEKIVRTLKRYPFLVAVNGEEILGYAYAAPFKERAAYDRCVETTIYLQQEHRRSGVGRALYTALEGELKKQGVLNLEACIAVTDRIEDEFLSNDSRLFHEKTGYRTVALFKKCGWKFDRWYDMIWMEKVLGAHEKMPAPFVPYGELCGKLKEKEWY